MYYSDEIRSQVQAITRAILPRNQSPSVSNSQRGRSCEQIFDSSTTFLNPLVGTNSLYGKRVRVARFTRVRLLRHALPISLLILRKNRLFCSLPTLERAIKPLSGELIERVTQIALIWGFKEGEVTKTISFVQAFSSLSP